MKHTNPQKVSDVFVQQALKMLIQDEGIRFYPYDDRTGKNVKAVGKVTVGIGRNLDANPLTMDEVMFLFRSDLEKAVEGVRRILPDYDGYTLPRQLALCAMAFAMGVGGLMGFRDMIRAIRSGDWDLASRESLNSTWGTGIHRRRAERIAYMLKTGEYHNEYI